MQEGVDSLIYSFLTDLVTAIQVQVLWAPEEDDSREGPCTCGAFHLVQGEQKQTKIILSCHPKKVINRVL